MGLHGCFVFLFAAIHTNGSLCADLAFGPGLTHYHACAYVDLYIYIYICVYIYIYVYVYTQQRERDVDR